MSRQTTVKSLAAFVAAAAAAVATSSVSATLTPPSPAATPAQQAAQRLASATQVNFHVAAAAGGVQITNTGFQSSGAFVVHVLRIIGGAAGGGEGGGQVMDLIESPLAGHTSITIPVCGSAAEYLRDGRPEQRGARVERVGQLCVRERVLRHAITSCRRRPGRPGRRRMTP